MQDLARYRTCLRGLVIFRNILNDPVIHALMRLLTPAADESDFADAYAGFCAALFAHGTDFTDHVKSIMLEDANIYLRKYSSARAQDGLMQECLRNEIAFLQELGQLSSEKIRQGNPFTLQLPKWRTHDEDFASAYADRVASLPQTGFGIFAHHHMFTVKDGALVPVQHPGTQSLADLPGYESEKARVMANTLALLQGKPANNVLLYGDAGTGKSSTVKAIANDLCVRGLRLVEIKKSQLFELPAIMESLCENPLKFIIFIDDLSFSSNDGDFTALKAILEGSVNDRSSNVAVYATSNRRHLIKESWEDRSGNDLHEADTRQELMSLSARFGLTVTFLRPDKKLYLKIVHALAEQYGLDMPGDQLDERAEAHAIRSGGRSPRAARQFVELAKAGVR